MKILTVCKNKEQVNDSRSFVIENMNTHWPTIYNEAIRRWNGEVILFLGESVLLPNTLDSVISIFEKFQNVIGAVYGEFKEPLSKYTNVPFFFSTKNVKGHYFNEALKTGYNNEFVTRIKSHMVYHIPATIYA